MAKQLTFSVVIKKVSPVNIHRLLHQLIRGPDLPQTSRKLEQNRLSNNVPPLAR
jgi:hypothetical protein